MEACLILATVIFGFVEYKIFRSSSKTKEEVEPEDVKEPEKEVSEEVEKADVNPFKSVPEWEVQ